MDWLVLGVGFALAVALLFSLALAGAGHRLAGGDRELRALAELDRISSSNGRPFYPNTDSFWELAQSLEGLERAGAPRGPPAPR